MIVNECQNYCLKLGWETEYFIVSKPQSLSSQDAYYLQRRKNVNSIVAVAKPGRHHMN